MFEHAFGIAQNLVIPEPKDPVAPGFEPRRALTFLGVAGVMLPSINFDDKADGGTEEIDDIGPDWVLTTKPETVELLSPNS